MIDTITIELNAPELSSKDFELKSQWGIDYQQGTNSEPIYTSNVILDWPAEAREKWSYLPEVKFFNFPDPQPHSLTGRLLKYWVTFSVPKLLYGNNIEEVTEDQYDEVVSLLCQQLRYLPLQIDIYRLNIQMAKIKRIDFCKNALISELVPADQFCRMLMRSEHDHRSKYTQIEYRHGDSYRENIKHRSVVVYDKLAELSNSIKKEGREPTTREQFFLAAEKAHLFQIFRLEVQLQNSNQVAQELSHFGLERDYINFGNVFTEELAHSVLMKYWKKLIDNLDPNPEPFSEDNILATFNEMVINRGNKTPMNLFATFGLRHLAYKCGLDNIKDIFSKEYGSQAWLRLKNLYEEPTLNQGLYTFISSMEKIIDNMEPLQFGEYNGVFEEEEA